MGQLIATEMGNRALNEKIGLPFLCLMRRLRQHAQIPDNKLVEQFFDATKLTYAVSIKNVVNPLYKTRAGPAAPLVIMLNLPCDPTKVEGAAGESTEGIT